MWASAYAESSLPRPFTATPRSGKGRLRAAFGGIAGASTTSNGPAAHATRYDGSGSVGANRTRTSPSFVSSRETSRVLAIATWPDGTVSVIVYGVLKRGSSKHGKASRAWVASNCVKE